MPEPMPLLEVSGLHVDRGQTHVLKGIDLCVRAGQVVALIGGNGAGKTTMLATISGLLRARQGTIRYRDPESGRDFDLTAYRAEEIVGRGIALCPEGRQVFASLTVRENLLVGAYLRTDKLAVNADLEMVLELFPLLAERRNLSAGNLSGGEQMMLVIGRSLMARPHLLLLDEPSLGLAPQAVDQIFDKLVAINREGTTLLLVEQNASMALELADRAYVIETGRIALSGSGRELAEDEDVRMTYLGIA